MAHQLPEPSQSPMSTDVPAGRVRMGEKFVPGPERKLTLVVVTPGTANAGTEAMIGMNASAMTWRIRDHSCNPGIGEVTTPGNLYGLNSAVSDYRTIIRPDGHSPVLEEYCTVPQEHPA